jgi:hypothetical protein
MPTAHITVDLDKKCVECRKPGAVANGLCLSCVSKAMTLTKPMKSAVGQAVQERYRRTVADLRKTQR